LTIAAELLEHLRTKHIVVRLEGDQLRCSAPPGVLTVGLLEQLQARKSDIVSFLRISESVAVSPRAVLPLQPRGTRPPIFGVGGPYDWGFHYRALWQALGTDQPFFGLEPPGLDDVTEPLHDVADLAGYFSASIRKFYPDGPLLIVGYCAGGTVAFELARRLLTQGRNVTLLVMLTSPYPTAYRAAAKLKWAGSRILHHALHISSLHMAERFQYISSRLRYHVDRPSREALAAAQDPVAARVRRVGDAIVGAVRRYQPQHFGGRIALILQNEAYKYHPDDRPVEWQHHAAAADVFCLPPQCDHDTMLTEFAPATARFIERSLVAASRI
jgi:thioesterase domain-containing protein